MPPPSPLDVTTFLCRSFYQTALFFHLEVHNVALCCPAWPLLSTSQYWQGSWFWSEVFLPHTRPRPSCCQFLAVLLVIIALYLAFSALQLFFSLGIWQKFLRAGPEGSWEGCISHCIVPLRPQPLPTEQAWALRFPPPVLNSFSTNHIACERIKEEFLFPGGFRASGLEAGFHCPSHEAPCSS